MAKLTRVTGKVFAGEADASQVGQFGSAKAGTPTNTTDIATIQQLAAYSNGWGSAVISDRNFPPLEEVNGVLKNISYQTCYILQEGVPTYDSGTEYSNTSLVKTVNEYGVLFYLSKQDGNTGHALSDTSWWERVYFQNGYEDEITANRSLTLSGAVSGTVNFDISDPSDYSLTINTTLPILNQIYPVGALYIGTMATCPLQTLGIGTWQLIEAGCTLQQADSNHPVGEGNNVIQPGLPNITGTFPAIEANNSLYNLDNYGDAVFLYKQNNASKVDNSNGDRDDTAGLNASRVSSIYGNSNTVQPKALAVNIWRRIA